MPRHSRLRLDLPALPFSASLAGKYGHILCLPHPRRAGRGGDHALALKAFEREALSEGQGRDVIKEFFDG